MAEVIFRPHLFNGPGTQHIEVGIGGSVADIMGQLDVPEHLHDYVECFVEGRHIARDDWHDVHPIDGDHILIAAVPHGGGGKDLLRIISIVALSYYSFGIVGGLAGAGIFVAGSLALNAIFPPPSVDPSGDSTSVSPTYSIQGQRNQTRPYGAAVRLYGQHRIWPPNVAQPYVQSLYQNKYLYSLLDVGYGNYDLDDIRIGETPISSFPESVVRKAVGTNENLNLRYYTRDTFTDATAIDLKSGVNNDRTSQLETTAVDIEITFPRGLTDFNNKGKKVWSYKQFSVQWKSTSSGIWQNITECESYAFSRNHVKLVNIGATDHGYLPYTPFNLSDEDTGTTKAEGALFRLIGSEFDPVQDRDPVNTVTPLAPLYGFPRGSAALQAEVFSTIAQNSVLYFNGDPYTVTATVSPGASVSIPIDPPLASDLITQQYEYTGPTTPSTPIAEYIAGGVAFAPTRPQAFEIRGGQLEPFALTVTLNFATEDQYDIRVIRRSPDQDEEKVTEGPSQSVWTQFRSVANRAPVNFPHARTYLDCRFMATDQLSGNIDTINCIATSYLNVWTTPTEVQYIPSRNPAWVIVDILTGASTPNPVPRARLDMQSFIDFAAWCDANTGDNSNVNEPRFRFDSIVDYNTTAWELARSVAATARAGIIQVDGLYTMIWDVQPSVPVQLITPHNSWNFEATRSFAEIPNAIKATFIDPDAGWQRGEVTVYDEGFDESNVLTFEEIPLLGVVRATQAWRDARYYLAQAKLRQEVFTVTMDVENIVCTRGDFVQVQHDAVRVGGEPGRIVSFAGNTVTLTEPAPQPGPEGLQLRVREVRSNSNDLVTYGITSVSGDGYTLTLDASFTGQVGELAVFGITDSVTGDYLIKEIQPGPDLTATLILTNLAPFVYQSDHGPIPPYNPPIAPDLRPPPPPVENLRGVQEPYELIDPGGDPNDPANHRVLFVYRERVPFSSLRIVWNVSDAAVTSFYDVYWLRADRWEYQGRTTEDNWLLFDIESDLDPASPGATGEAHEVKVVAVNAIGTQLPLDAVPTLRYTMKGDDIAPGPVQQFWIEEGPDAMQLNWIPGPDPDIDYYGVRYSFVNNASQTFEDSNLVIPTIPHNVTQVTVPSRPGTYWLVAQDTSGNLGTPVSAVTSTFPARGWLNIHAFHEAPIGGPYWEGAKENVAVAPDNSLVLIDPTQEGIYYFSNSSFFLLDVRVRLGTFVDAVGVEGPNAGGTPSPYWAVLTEAQFSSGGTFMSDWDTLTEVAFLSDDEPSFVSEWTPFFTTDIVATQVSYRYRIFSADDGVTQPRLLPQTNPFAGHILVSGLPRTESGSVDDGGTTLHRIDYSNGFFAPPTILITLEAATSDVSYTITNVQTLFFEVQITVSGGGSGAFNWAADGFGLIEAGGAALGQTGEII